MNMRVILLFSIVVMTLVVGGCNSATEIKTSFQAPEYTDFQWSILSQGRLILIEKGEHLWPAYQVDNAILESFPPQVRLKLHHDDSDIVKTISSLVSPRELSNKVYLAQISKEGEWVVAESFTLVDVNFMVVTVKGDEPESIDITNIRFIKKK